MKKAEGFLIILCFFLRVGSEKTAFAQDTVHGYAESIELGPHSVRFSGQVRLLHTQLQVFALSAQQGPHSLRLQGDPQEPVRLRSDRWELSAQRVYGERSPMVLQAEQALLRFDDPAFQIAAEIVQANAHRWHFQQVRAVLPGVPGVLRAEQAYYLPESETLWLQGVSYAPLVTSLDQEHTHWVLPWPDVQWHFETVDALHVRPDFWAIQPRLRWGSLENPWQGLDIGALAELWRTETQRAYGGLYYAPATGWRTSGIWEWRPQPGTTWVAQGQWQGQALPAQTAASLDYYQAFEAQNLGLTGPLWTHVGAFVQQPDQFLQRFGLPLRLTSTLQSGLQATVTTAPEIALDGRLEHMAMLGFQGGTQQRLSALWRGDLQLGQWGIHGFSGSTQAHVLYSPERGLAPTVGLRLTDTQRWDEHWLTGVYAEQYLSSLPATDFWAGRLSPWAGGFVQWRGEQVAFGADAALDVTTGVIRQWNVLSSWRYESLFLHVGWLARSEPMQANGFVGGPQVSLQWVLP